MSRLTFWETLIYWRDFVYSMTVIWVARLLPSLRPPRVDLSNKTAIVTGANSGIGLQLAADFTRDGATVYLACRDKTKAQQAISQIVSLIPQARDRVHAFDLDVSDLSSVRRFAEVWSRLDNKTIDILCHNAGMPKFGPGEEFTLGDQLERMYTTNFLGSFLLTHLLEKYLAPTARVVFTSSMGTLLSSFSPDFALGPMKGKTEAGFHYPVYQAFGTSISPDDCGSRYGNTKAMQVAFTRLLQRHFDQKASVAGDGSRRTVHAYGAGFIQTPIFGKLGHVTWSQDPLYCLLKNCLALGVSVDQGAATGYWLATTNEEQVMGKNNVGGYWDRMTRRLNVGDTLDNEILDRMWTRWERDAGVEWR